MICQDTQISPEAHAAARTALQVKVRNGKPLYVVFGVVETSDWQEVLELLADIERRSTPREVQLMPAPVDVAALNARAGYREIDERGPVEPWPWQR